MSKEASSSELADKNPESDLLDEVPEDQVPDGSNLEQFEEILSLEEDTGSFKPGTEHEGTFGRSSCIKNKYCTILATQKTVDCISKSMC